MSRVHVLTKKEELDTVRLPGKVVIVLDILFATTTMVAALAQGAAEIVPVLDGDSARAAARRLPEGSFVLSGELHAETLPGFAHPTPLALTRTACKGKIAGPLHHQRHRGAHACRRARRASIARALLNARALVEHVHARHPRETVLLVCAGSGNNFNFEDFYGAGHLAALRRGRPAPTSPMPRRPRARSTTAARRGACSHWRVGRMMLARGLAKRSTTRRRPTASRSSRGSRAAACAWRGAHEGSDLLAPRRPGRAHGGRAARSAAGARPGVRGSEERVAQLSRRADGARALPGEAAAAVLARGGALGVVRSVGEGVERSRIGEAVIGLSGHGACAQLCLVDVARTMPLPEGVDFDVAAAFALTYGTALHALRDVAALQPNETLAVLGAAGGTGIAAIECGKALGARVIACASSAEKLALCREHGADDAIDYSGGDLRGALDALAGKRGVDVVFDAVGGQYTEPAFRATGWRGRLLVIGFAAGEIPKLPLNLALLKERQSWACTGATGRGAIPRAMRATCATWSPGSTRAACARRSPSGSVSTAWRARWSAWPGARCWARWW